MWDVDPTSALVKLVPKMLVEVTLRMPPWLAEP